MADIIYMFKDRNGCGKLFFFLFLFCFFLNRNYHYLLLTDLLSAHGPDSTIKGDLRKVVSLWEEGVWGQMKRTTTPSLQVLRQRVKVAQLALEKANAELNSKRSMASTLAAVIRQQGASTLDQKLLSRKLSIDLPLHKAAVDRANKQATNTKAALLNTLEVFERYNYIQTFCIIDKYSLLLLLFFNFIV